MRLPWQKRIFWGSVLWSSQTFQCQLIVPVGARSAVSVSVSVIRIADSSRASVQAPTGGEVALLLTKGAEIS